MQDRKNRSKQQKRHSSQGDSLGLWQKQMAALQRAAQPRATPKIAKSGELASTAHNDPHRESSQRKADQS